MSKYIVYEVNGRPCTGSLIYAPNEHEHNIQVFDNEHELLVWAKGKSFVSGFVVFELATGENLMTSKIEIKPQECTVNYLLGERV